MKRRKITEVYIFAFLLPVLAGIILLRVDSKELKWQEQYDLGVRYLSEGNYQEAIVALKAAIEIEPKQADAFIALANAYLAAGDIDAAIKVLEEALARVTDIEAIEEKLREIQENQDTHGDQAVEENVAQMEEAVDESEKLPENPSVFQAGVYAGVDAGFRGFDSLTIHEVNEHTITFSAFWYRTNSIDFATAEISGNLAIFEWEREFASERYDYTTGYLEIMEDGTIVLALTETELSYIETGKYTYQFEGTAEEVQIGRDTEVLQQGLYAKAIGLHSGDSWVDAYIRFNRDGSLEYWRVVIAGPETKYLKFFGNYQIGAKMLYIDGNAYDLYTERTAYAQFSLATQGDYPVDFSGEYQEISSIQSVTGGRQPSLIDSLDNEYIATPQRPISGVYTEIVDAGYPEMASRFAFYSEDKTFTLTINLLTGWGTATGTYTEDGYGLICCTIDNTNFSGFTYANANEIYLVLIDDTLYFQDALNTHSTTYGTRYATISRGTAFVYSEK